MEVKTKQIVLWVMVLFAAFEVLVAAGFLDITNSPLLPPNLQTTENWYDNPVIWVIGLTLLVNFAGFVENTVINDQTYDIHKFEETFFKYMPMLVIFSQVLPNGQGAMLSFVLDYLSRALKSRTTP